MNKLFRFLFIAGVLAVVLVVGVGITIKIYLNEGRLRTLILPPMREALGREVEVASLKIDLFSGIKVGGLAIKEADGKTDFVAVKEFSLGYSLMPLLEKRLEISRVRVEQPVIKVWRNRQGLYNFSDLKVLQAKIDSGGGDVTPEADKKAPTAALPLALVVQRLEITDAALSFHDEIGEFPAVDLKATLKTRLDLGDLKPESINGTGDLDFSLTASYKTLTPQVKGHVEFDRQQVVYKVKVKQAEEELLVDGSVSDYLGAKPALVLNLGSPRLDLAYLAALGQKLSPAAEKSTPDQPEPVASASSTPPSLTARGGVNIRQAVYENYKVDNFTLTYLYENALLTISDLKGEVADGSFAAAAKVEPFLAQPDFKGTFSFADLKIKALMAMAAPALQKNLSGAGHGEFTFSGRGADPATLKQNLSLAGEYGVRQGGLDNIPLTKSLSQILGLPELDNLEFAELNGNLRLKDGQLNLNNSWSGEQFKGQAKGNIGLDGSLDMPVNLILSRHLSEKMAQRYPWVKETFNEQQEAAVGLTLAGTLDKPKLRLDEKKVQEQLQKKLEKKIFDKLDEKLSAKDGKADENSGKVKPEDLLRQFLKK